jgi:hypothetical protein
LLGGRRRAGASSRGCGRGGWSEGCSSTLEGNLGGLRSLVPHRVGAFSEKLGVKAAPGRKFGDAQPTDPLTA